MGIEQSSETTSEAASGSRVTIVVPWSLLAYNPRFDGYELRIADKQTSPRT